MLQDCVLLEAIGIPAVIKSDQIINRDTAVKNLASDEHVERRSQLELAIIGKQLLHIIIGIHLRDHELARLQRFHDRFHHVFDARDRDALQFGFEVLVKDTEWEPLALELEYVPRMQRCPKCAYDFQMTQFDPRCPLCGEYSTECISGDQLELAYLEMEEHEPSTA